MRINFYRHDIEYNKKNGFPQRADADFPFLFFAYILLVSFENIFDWERDSAKLTQTICKCVAGIDA